MARLPSGIGERTLLAYEHGLRELAVLRLLELCTGLRIEPTDVLRLSLQSAGVLLDNLALRIDLRALLTHMSPKFRPMHQWPRNKLNSCTDGITELAPVAVREPADFIGCSHDELATYLARFTPDEDAVDIHDKRKASTHANAPCSVQRRPRRLARWHRR